MGAPPTIAFIHDGREDTVVREVAETVNGYTIRDFESVRAVRSAFDGQLDGYVVKHDPPWDGFDIVDRLRSSPAAQPIVMFSRSRDAAVATRAVNEDIDRYVAAVESRTETVRHLAEMIDEIVEIRGREREREFEWYEMIVEATGDPVYTLDEDGYVTYANEALAEMTGYDIDDVVGRHVETMMRNPHVERGEALIKRLLDAEDSNNGTFEMDCLRADGGHIRCENHVALLPSANGFGGTVGVLRDVTHRKRRERELQEERDRLTAVFETIPEPIAHIRYEDDEPVVENVNPSFEETFGLDAADLRDRSINEAIVPESVIDEARSIDASSATVDFVEQSVRRETTDGVRDFLLRATRFDVGDRERESIVAYVDVTEQKERQRELERQNERLDRFASVVSHDLRNPLNVATGKLALLREECQSEHIADLEHSLDRMAELIENVLRMAGQGKPVRSEDDLDLRKLAQASWRNVRTDERATLEIDDDVSFAGERARVRSIFENLFRNAVEHGGGDTTVRVEAIESGFAIEDDGSGLPNGGDRVFETGYTTSDEGTGFGLSIVREVVRAHGWSIRATTGRDGGARFEITVVETDS
ncbi:MAG: PAS domain S-box protein [archaeon]